MKSRKLFWIDVSGIKKWLGLKDEETLPYFVAFGMYAWIDARMDACMDGGMSYFRHMCV